jgi:hypothetical protein
MAAVKSKTSLVYAYGFDSLGFSETSDLEHDQFTIRFIPYRSTDSLEGADGLLIPSGIFETFETHSPHWQPYTTCRSDTHRMAEREKQIFNAWDAGAWTCFLLRALDNGTDNRWSGTDLAKKIANQMFKKVADHDPTPHLYSKADEFRDFFKTYGIARTTLEGPEFPAKTRRLATAVNDGVIYAAEFAGSFFFLPLKSLQNAGSELPPLLRSVTESVLVYKQRHDFYLPDWLKDLRFKSEAALDQRISDIEKEIIQLKEDSRLWERYKGILCASGRTLNEIVVTVLRVFFQLKLHSEEAYVEDAIIYDIAGQPVFVVEIKGVNGGVKREHINQVDSHRERLELSPSISGLLIINDFADVPNLEERRSKQIDNNHLELAKRQNVRVLRTTTLIDLMLSTEEMTERASVFVEICLAGAPLVQLPAH